MKIVGIGDLFIPASYIEKGFAPLREKGHIVDVMDWPLKSFDELQNYNLLVETQGCQALQPPQCVFELCADADVIVTQFCTVTRELVDACPKLKAIGVLRGGIENVCSEYAREKGIEVFNAPGRNAEAVSDFTVGMIICEARNIARGHHGILTGRWIRDYSNSGMIPDLPGRTVGLIGCGAIGMKVAKKLSGFDMTLLGYDPFASAERCKEAGIEPVELDELMARADFVSLHARLTAENRHLIDARRLALMKPTAYLINTSRAGLIDEAALVEALRAKKIAGAALDVYEHEPPQPDDPLLALDNVTLTPHMAGGSNDAFFNTPILLRKRMEAWIDQH